MDLGLAGRPASVTGASRGIGRETARHALRRGRATCCSSPAARSELAEAADECGAAGAAAAAAPTHWPLDVTDADAGERIVADGRASASASSTCSSTTPAPPRWRDLDDVPDEDWYAAWELNVMAPMRADAGGGPGDGRARLGPGRQRLLDRRQAPLGGDARVLGGEGRRALALAPVRRPLRGASGVLVNAVCPGPGQVGAVDGRRAACSTSRGELGGHDEPRGGARGGRRRSGRSAASPRSSEIAAAIVFLCSERASYVAGAAWCVDGGTVQVII